MPYGAWFDTVTRECGKLVKDCAISGDYNYPASITVCWENGNALFSITSGASLPAAGTLNAAFILESDTPKLYKCTTASSEGVVAAWTEVTSVKYVFTFKDKGYSFAERPSYGTLKYYYIAPHSGFIKKSSDIFAATETKYVPTYSSLTENWTLTFPSAAIDFDILRTEMRGDVTIARFEVYNDIPDIDYVCAAYNRVWGCGRNGTEIYASALGDATKWHSYEGRVSDSWAATVAEGGEWTGAVTYNGYPLFFKKDRVFRVSGSKPSSFGYRAYSMMGCYDNASFAVVNDRLYYMGKDGIYEISADDMANATGTINYESACAVGQRLPKVYVY
ncbi:MAG: hypothetical protein IKQ18_05925 [Clostridia bacterium]|nr:hypothetical protein [Clostridia bacterium]